MTHKRNIIKDNILGTILFDEEYADLYSLTQTKEFNRLHDINQIAFLDRYISSASVTRFAHSLGVYEILRRIFSKSSFKNLSLQVRRETLAAALLHDIGHAPFSHTFEAIFPNFNHELQTVSIIEGKTQINTVLRELKIEPNTVANIIAKRPVGGVKQFQIDLISSQLDVDRVDYFFRDSYACGFAYGRFDLGLFLEYINLQEDKIVFDNHLTSLIVDFLSARYKSYLFTYRNKEGQTITFILQNIFKLLFANTTDLSSIKKIKTCRIYPLLENLFFNQTLNVKDFSFLDDNTFKSFLKDLWITLQEVPKLDKNLKQVKFLLDNIFIENNFLWKMTLQTNDEIVFIATDSSPKKIIYNPNKQPILIRDGKSVNELSNLPLINLIGLTETLPSEKYGIFLPKELWTKHWTPKGEL